MGAPAQLKKEGIAPILEHVSIGCNMMGSLIGALGCWLGNGI